MAKTEKMPAPPVEKKTADEWAKERKTAPYVLAAVKTERDWVQGKLITADEFDRAVDSWLHGSVLGR